jgi:hypothetical protein
MRDFMVGLLGRGGFPDPADLAFDRKRDIQVMEPGRLEDSKGRAILYDEVKLFKTMIFTDFFIQ